MKYKLDLDDCDSPLDGWAILHFRTQQPAYAFADCLNRLYGYRLRRLDDMPLEGAQWPFYHHEDTVGHLKYYLVERPPAATGAPWEPGDKLLLIKGDSAPYVADDLYADFTTTAPADDHDLLAREHAECMDSLLANFTVVTLLSLDGESDTHSRRGQKERAAMQRHCELILTYIEQQHLDLGAAERLRLALGL